MFQETPTNGYIRQTHGTSAWTSEREALLGPANTDLQSCRPEHGLGGMWAHVNPGLNELFVQGSHVVPDGNSSTSAQIFADGSSSCSQIFVDNSACVSSSSPVSTAGGTAAARDSHAVSERKAESDVKAGGITLLVPGGKPTPSPSLTIAEGKSGIPALVVSDEKSDSNGKIETPVVTVLGGKSGASGKLDSDVKLESSVLAASGGKTGSSGKSVVSAKVVPGEKSLGIAALAMLGGKMTSAHGSPGIPRSALPSVAVEESNGCTTNRVIITAEDSTLQLVTTATKGDEAISSNDDVQGETIEDHTTKIRSARNLSVEDPTVEDATVEDGSSSSSSSLQAICEIHPLPTMLGLPDCVSPFQGSQLSARDMIDICEERIYSDYKCPVETGGVDDLILNDSRFDDVDEEIIVAVQSRRNSRRKDGPHKSPAVDTGTNIITTVRGPTPGGPTPAGDDFVSSLTAALAATLGDSDQGRTGVKDVVASGDKQDGTCDLRKEANGDCGEDI